MILLCLINIYRFLSPRMAKVEKIPTQPALSQQDDAKYGIWKTDGVAVTTERTECRRKQQSQCLYSAVCEHASLLSHHELRCRCHDDDKMTDTAVDEIMMMMLLSEKNPRNRRLGACRPGTMPETNCGSWRKSAEIFARDGITNTICR